MARIISECHVLDYLTAFSLSILVDKTDLKKSRLSLFEIQKE